jgi:2-haloacid dehalogenase
MRSIRICSLLVIAVIALSGGESRAQSPRFKAVAFDFFVLFDPGSVTPRAEEAFPGQGAEFTRRWRTKQFEYCFLRSITGRYADFFAVTEDALVYTAKAMKLDLTPEKRERLMNAYLSLEPWPDAKDALVELRAAGLRIITIANFSAQMLRANADRAGMTALFDELLSTEAEAVFKPDPRAYELGLQRLKLRKDQVVFAAFGGWDAYGAKSFGYPTYWVNRFAFPAEALGLEADATSRDLRGLVEFATARGRSPLEGGR